MFHLHKWIMVAVYANYGLNLTYILYRCSKCGKHKVERLPGKWSEETLRQEPK